jgi:hypothetical protein
LASGTKKPDAGSLRRAVFATQLIAKRVSPVAPVLVSELEPGVAAVT